MTNLFTVFKKSSLNKNITLYMDKRDFVDHVHTVDPVDGVIKIDTEALGGRKVFGQLVCSFRYGRVSDEVMGLCFQKDLFLASEQIYPTAHVISTNMQARLMRRLGPNTFPFTFIMPSNAPPSITLLPGPLDEERPCGVEYYVKFFVGNNEKDLEDKSSIILLNIRRIQFAPTNCFPQPSTVVMKDFMLSPGKLELEVSLDRHVYNHGGEISINFTVTNTSNKAVRKVKASVQQIIDVGMLSCGPLRMTVASKEIHEGCPIIPGATMESGLVLTPKLSENQRNTGVALDGHLKNIQTNLASTTLLSNLNSDEREIFGIVVSYVVRVKLYLGAIGGELVAELPFTLMNPKIEKIQGE